MNLTGPHDFTGFQLGIFGGEWVISQQKPFLFVVYGAKKATAVDAMAWCFSGECSNFKDDYRLK